MNLKVDKKFLLIVFLFSSVLKIGLVFSNETLSSKENKCFNNYNHSSENIVNIKNMNIEVHKSRKWFENILNIYKEFSSSDIINPKFKKKYPSAVNVSFVNNEICDFEAEIRVTGLSKFHFSKENFMSSIDVKLLNGHIHNITRFKLLLPKSRYYDNEIFVTTLLNELNFLVPKTFYVNTLLNGKKQKFIFQEKMSKEFLERYKLREGPIYVYSNKTKDYPMLKIENASWIKSQKEKFYSSSEGLSKLHDLYKIKKDNLIDINFNQLKNNEEFLSYNSLMIALNASHGLGIFNRALYYDPISKVFRPIYNDGKPSILNDKNLNDNYFSKRLSEVNLIKNSTVKIKKEIENIDINKFQDQLIRNGISLNRKEIISKLNLISERLDYIKIQKEKLNLRPKNNRKNPQKQKHVFFKSVNSLEICEKYDQNCFTENNVKDLFKSKKKISHDNYIYSRLLKNDFKNDTYHFYGNKNINTENFRNFKLYREIENFNLFTNDQVKIENIDFDKKIISISQTGTNGRAIVKGKKISNWSINFQGLSTGNQIIFNNLTGCITFIDIEVSNINIKTKNGICEDTVNFIRSNGVIKNYSSNNSFSDSLDLDFSEIKIDNVVIENARNDCVDFSGGKYFISKGLFKFCGDKGISVGERSSVKISYSLIENSNIGIASKDGSSIQLNEVNIQKVETCLASYKKKQEFSGGLINVENFKCGDFTKNFRKDNFSKIIVNNNEV